MSFSDEADVEVYPPVAVGMWEEQVLGKLRKWGRSRYDSHKEFWVPRREDWVGTPSFIFKDSCSRGVGIKSMQGLYLVSSWLFCSCRKKDASVIAVAAEIVFKENWTQGGQNGRPFIHKCRQGYTHKHTLPHMQQPSVLCEITRPYWGWPEGWRDGQGKADEWKSKKSGHAWLPFAM